MTTTHFITANVRVDGSDGTFRDKDFMLLIDAEKPTDLDFITAIRAQNFETDHLVMRSTVAWPQIELHPARTLRQAMARLKDRSAESMARVAHDILRQHAAAAGQNPDVEVMIKAPGEPRHFADTSCWAVAWEAGPYEWAIPASMTIGDASGKLVEPYYSFDLCFYPSEDTN